MLGTTPRLSTSTSSNTSTSHPTYLNLLFGFADLGVQLVTLPLQLLPVLGSLRVHHAWSHHALSCNIAPPVVHIKQGEALYCSGASCSAGTFYLTHAYLTASRCQPVLSTMQLGVTIIVCRRGSKVVLAALSFVVRNAQQTHALDTAHCKQSLMQKVRQQTLATLDDGSKPMMFAPITRKHMI